MTIFKLLASVESLTLEDDPEVIAMFPSFEIRGLGRTSLETHTIETGDAEPVKQRHYPVSPAVQCLMSDELDRMLGLKIIEHRQNPWNNLVTLVGKGTKNRLCLEHRYINSVV